MRGWYGRVRKNTTPAWRTDRRTSIDSPHEVSEDGLEAVVRALQPSDVEPAVEDNPREVPIEGIGLPRADEDLRGRRELDRGDVVEPCEGLGDVPRSGGRDPDRRGGGVAGGAGGRGA